MKINILNKRNISRKLAANDIYIGRGSRFGNPFPMRRENEREEVISKYRDYFYSNSSLMEFTIRRFKSLKKRGFEEVNLVCFCAPKRCHGEILKEFINNNI